MLCATLGVPIGIPPNATCHLSGLGVTQQRFCLLLKAPCSHLIHIAQTVMYLSCEDRLEDREECVELDPEFLPGCRVAVMYIYSCM